MSVGGNRPRGEAPAAPEDLTGILINSHRFVPAVLVLASIAVGAIILIYQSRVAEQLAQHQLEESRLRMASALGHVEEYFDSIYSSLLFISLDPAVKAMRTDSREFIQNLYDHQWEHHRLSEVYVVERGFAGGQKPFQAFERSASGKSVESIHSPLREAEEYKVVQEQMRQFFSNTNLPALLSSEIQLCIDDPAGRRARGFVYSVPIRSSEGLQGLVAGMIPTYAIHEVLSRGGLLEFVLIVNERGEIYGGDKAGKSVPTWLRSQFTETQPSLFFQQERFAVHEWTAVTSPAQIVSGEKWWLLYLYGRDPHLQTGLVGMSANTALAGAVVLTGIALALLTRAYRKRLEEQVSHLRERQALERQVQEASDREQRRLGENLHEDLCQRLAGIQAASKALEKRLASSQPPESSLAGEIADEIHESLNRAQQMADQLQPVTLLEEGFHAAIAKLAALTEKRSGVPCGVELHDFPGIHDPVVATHLYRIVQEAVSNAVKHSKASRITICLSSNSQGMVVSVSDNGVGLSAQAAQQGGMGLKIMRYRSDVIGGQLEIMTAKGGGTIVRFTSSRA